MLNKNDDPVMWHPHFIMTLLNTSATDIDKIIIAKTILVGPTAGARDKKTHKQMVF